MILVDGGFGEGGGQILRSSLTLSLLTGKPFRVENLRARRKNPGLAPQHLQAFLACARICGAETRDVERGATELTFQPGPIASGRYLFEIGTAGSATLVLQTVLLPLLGAPGPSEVTVRGGTHVPWSPSYHYLERQWLPCLAKLGANLALELVRTGFYPRGGGEIRAAVAGGRPVLRGLDWTEPGRCLRFSGLSAVANLDMGIARRQARQAEERLREAAAGERRPIVTAELPGRGRGTMLLLLAELESGRCGSSALGERGKPAERVADEAVDALLGDLARGGAVDEHLADQLLLPLALAAGESRFRTPRITSHLLTNARVIRKFLPVSLAIEGEENGPGLVRVAGGGWPQREG